MKSMHISTARVLLARKEPVSVSYVTKAGHLETIQGAIPLAANFYAGTRNFKLQNGEIRKVRDNLIIAINNIEVFL